MEARLFGAKPLLAPQRWLAVAVLIGVPAVGSSLSSPAHAAGYRTTNFVVDAPTPQLAKEIGDTAEAWRKQLATEWLGRELPRWAQPCPIKARVSPRLGAGGATSFIFDRGEVFGWDMNVQGSRERVLDSVLPHEITHTIFATHFRQPVPRWADEGACTTVEHRSEIAKQERMLLDFLKARPGHPGRGIPFDSMFQMKEYPQDVLPLYAQGHSLSVYLIGQKGKRAFLEFLADGLQDDNWPRAIRQHYGYQHLLALQNSWLDWVKAGRPELHPPTDGATMLASATTPVRAMPASTTISPKAPDAGAHAVAAAAPSPNHAASASPTATSAAYGDWTTRQALHSASSADGGRGAGSGGAQASSAWR